MDGQRRLQLIIVDDMNAVWLNNDGSLASRRDSVSYLEYKAAVVATNTCAYLRSRDSVDGSARQAEALPQRQTDIVQPRTSRDVENLDIEGLHQQLYTYLDGDEKGEVCCSTTAWICAALAVSYASAG